MVKKKLAYAGNLIMDVPGIRNEAPKVAPDPVWFTPNKKELYRELLPIVANHLGCVLRYRTLDSFCWPELKRDTPVFMITENTTVEQFMKAVEELIKNSGDCHHIFIEAFEQDGCWLDICTGS